MIELSQGNGGLIGLPPLIDFSNHSIRNLGMASFQSYDSVANYGNKRKLIVTRRECTVKGMGALLAYRLRQSTSLPFRIKQAENKMRLHLKMNTL